jgi:hypothetical protein
VIVISPTSSCDRSTSVRVTGLSRPVGVKFLASSRIRIVAAPMNTGIPDAGTLGQAELADWVNVERRSNIVVFGVAFGLQRRLVEHQLRDSIGGALLVCDGDRRFGARRSRLTDEAERDDEERAAEARTPIGSCGGGHDDGGGDYGIGASPSGSGPSP